MKPWLRMSLRVGTLAIPVGIVSKKTTAGSSMKKIHTDCKTQVELRAWCEHHQRVLAPEETTKAYELARGQLLPLTDQEIAALSPDDTYEIRITSVVDASHAQTVETSYWLQPDTPVGRRPYVLLARVLSKTGLVALSRTTVKGSEWVCAIRAQGDVLILDRLVLAEDQVDAAPIEEQLKQVEISYDELHLGTELLLSLFRKNGPRTGELSSPHRQRVTDLIDRKLAGQNIVSPAKPEAAPEPLQLPVGNLEDLLRASIRDVRRRPPAKRARRRTAAK